jgi:hypothetical protein
MLDSTGFQPNFLRILQPGKIYNWQKCRMVGRFNWAISKKNNE